jgi:pyruvate/2-oxoglutarate dehydrogenase complex dihydrolipoamide acyltransferase (E2) component
VTAVRLSDEAWQGVDADVEALLERWLVAEGDTVTAGQPVAQAVLVKTTIELVAPNDGVVRRILVPQDGTFGRGQDLAVID